MINVLPQNFAALHLIKHKALYIFQGIISIHRSMLVVA
jgi:hypothetical protein